MRIHWGLLLATLPGCIFGSPASGDWFVQDFQRFEINGSSFSTTEEEGRLVVEGGDAMLDVEFQTADFGRLEWEMDGDAENLGGGQFRFALDGRFLFFDDGQRAQVLVTGDLDCFRDRNAMDCESDFDGERENYRIETAFERP